MSRLWSDTKKPTSNSLNLCNLHSNPFFPMVSYVITGGRGIGVSKTDLNITLPNGMLIWMASQLEFAAQLSVPSDNLVFSLVRDTKSVPQLTALSAERKNLHVLQADITDLPALRVRACPLSLYSPSSSPRTRLTECGKRNLKDNRRNSRCSR